MRKEIIGREKEMEIFGDLLKSKDSEFLAVYGRRRVGKTFLIREYFSKAAVYIEVVGVKDAAMKIQLQNFMAAISPHVYGEIPLQHPKSWKEAFYLFTKALEKIRKKKVVLFLDELPWLATKRSGCLQMLDYFWNAHWSKSNSLILIACGSAASWMLDNLIHAKGGLYNRVTKRILLEPFNLRETEDYLISRSVRMSHKQIAELYMAIGGIPYYLREVKKGQSATQAIDALCFTKTGVLNEEFTNLFYALFDQAELNYRIVKEIARNGNKISREKLIGTMQKSSGGRVNERLKELEVSGFIRCFIPYGKKRRDRYYRIVDEYTLFYLKWIEPMRISIEDSYWQKVANTPAKCSWAGFAFENLCFKHLSQVMRALGIHKIAALIGTWSYLPKKGSKDFGTQIDLLFDRDDGVITLCEIKFSDQKLVVDKALAKELLLKMQVFEKHFGTKKQVEMALVAANGFKKNIWSEDLIQREASLQDLFL